MSNVAQEPGPHFFLGCRLAADVSRDLGVRPHRGAMHKIADAMRSQPEPLGFEDRNYGGKRRARHRCSLLVCAHHVKRTREYRGQVYVREDECLLLEQHRAPDFAQS
jgi:hypothetical protein